MSLLTSVLEILHTPPQVSVKFADLEDGGYTVLTIKRVQCKNAQAFTFSSIRITLQGGEVEYSSFLPQRIAKNLTDEHVQFLSGCKLVSLIKNGFNVDWNIEE